MYSVTQNLISLFLRPVIKIHIAIKYRAALQIFNLLRVFVLIYLFSDSLRRFLLFKISGIEVFKKPQNTNTPVVALASPKSIHGNNIRQILCKFKSLTSVRTFKILWIANTFTQTRELSLYFFSMVRKKKSNFLNLLSFHCMKNLLFICVNFIV